MFDLVLDLGTWATNALVDALGPHPSLLEPLPLIPATRPEFGDLQISACLQLAKPLAKPPRDLAAIVQTKLAAHPSVEKATIAGPGYVNLTLNNAYLAEQVLALFENETRGIRPAFQGETVVVDFSSPNVAKPMHIGHIRSTILGDAIRRILKTCGYQVVADNHLGDWGTQFGKLLVAYKHWLNPAAYAKDALAELVRLYQLFVSEEKKQADALGASLLETEEEEDFSIEGAPPSQKATPLLAEARSELAKLQHGNPENLALWQEFVRVSLATFQRSYDRLGVHFDVVHGESFYHPYLAPLVERLLKEGIAEHSQGAVICQVEGAPAPLLIRKADGAFLYGTSDLATIEYRVRTWNPSRILYVVGTPQQLHFKQVFAIAQKMGIRCHLEHISFGSMRFRDPDTGQWSMGSTRKGNVPFLEEMLDEALARAKVVVREKNPSLPEVEVDEIARKISLGAIKYNDLARDRHSDIHFDLEQALSLEGNTAPYIQYAYARLCSILRKAKEEAGFQEEKGTILLQLPSERTLALRLLEYPWIVHQVAKSVRIHVLAEYLYQLAGAVSQFYHEAPVLKADPPLRISRLHLLKEVAKTLQHGLSLLGIETPERM